MERGAFVSDPCSPQMTRVYVYVMALVAIAILFLKWFDLKAFREKVVLLLESWAPCSFLLPYHVTLS